VDTAPSARDAAATDGRYDFSVHGADGFVRRFSGTVVRDGGQAARDGMLSGRESSTSSPYRSATHADW
jgi:hypothetical protein